MTVARPLTEIVREPPSARGALNERGVPPLGRAHRPAHGRAAQRARVGHRVCGVRARGLHAALPAFRLPVDAKSHPEEPSSSSSAPSRRLTLASRPRPARSSKPNARSSTDSTPLSNRGEPGSARGITATSTSARCFTPGRTSSSSTSRASRLAPSATARSSAHPSATSPACCARSSMRRTPVSSIASSTAPSRPNPRSSRRSSGGDASGRPGHPSRSCWSYLETAEAHYLPETMDELGRILDVFLLEKALYELGYELNSRPDWVRDPTRQHPAPPGREVASPSADVTTPGAAAYNG